MDLTKLSDAQLDLLEKAQTQGLSILSDAELDDLESIQVQQPQVPQKQQTTKEPGVLKTIGDFYSPLANNAVARGVGKAFDYLGESADYIGNIGRLGLMATLPAKGGLTPEQIKNTLLNKPGGVGDEETYNKFIKPVIGEGLKPGITGVMKIAKDPYNLIGPEMVPAALSKIKQAIQMSKVKELPKSLLRKISGLEKGEATMYLNNTDAVRAKVNPIEIPVKQKVAPYKAMPKPENIPAPQPTAEQLAQVNSIQAKIPKVIKQAQDETGKRIAQVIKESGVNKMDISPTVRIFDDMIEDQTKMINQLKKDGIDATDLVDNVKRLSDTKKQLFGNSTNVSPETAMIIQQRLNNFVNSWAGSTTDPVINASKKSWDSLNDGFDSLTDGMSSQYKGRYKELITDKKALSGKITDTDKFTKILTNPSTDTQKIIDRLDETNPELGIKTTQEELRNIQKAYNTEKVAQKDAYTMSEFERKQAYDKTVDRINKDYESAKISAEEKKVAIDKLREKLGPDAKGSMHIGYQGTAALGGALLAQKFGMNPFLGASLVGIGTGVLKNPRLVRTELGVYRGIKPLIKNISESLVGSQVPYTVNGLAQPLTQSLYPAYSLKTAYNTEGE